jgi:hypothetical protein
MADLLSSLLNNIGSVSSAKAHFFHPDSKLGRYNAGHTG